MRLLIAQYGGDYRKAFNLVRNEGIETYNSQKYVIEFDLSTLALVCWGSQKILSKGSIQPV